MSVFYNRRINNRTQTTTLTTGTNQQNMKSFISFLQIHKTDMKLITYTNKAMSKAVKCAEIKLF